jgi:hypothetical protein
VLTQRMLPALPWDGAANHIPSFVRKERGDRAFPLQTPQHIVKKSLVIRHLRHPFLTVQWGEEQSRIDRWQDPSQRLKPARIPWEGPWHHTGQPHRRGPAWVDNEHSRVANASAPQATPDSGP